jgi:hypothetical protein
MLVRPSVVLEVNVSVIVPSVIVEVVPPLESPRGLPFDNGIHTNQPLHTMFIGFFIVTLESS